MATEKTKLALVLLLGFGAAAIGAGAVAQRVRGAKQPDSGQQAKAAEPPKPEGTRQARTDYYNDPLPPGVLARMGSVQLRHTGGARLAFTGDGKTLVSVGWDAVVSFWDMATGRLARRTQIRLPKSPELQPGAAVAGLSPGGKFLAAFWEKWVLVYDTATGQEVRRLPGGGNGYQYAAFSRDGKLLVTLLGSGGRYVFRLWDLPSGKERFTLPDASFIGDFALSPDGKLLGRREGEGGKESLSVWDTATGQQRGRIQLARDGSCVAFSPDGKTLASVDRHGTVTLWEAATLKKQATLKPAAASRDTYGLGYSPDGTLLAEVTDKDVVLWEVASRTERRRLDDRGVRRFEFAPDGRTLACAGEFEIHLWDPTTGAEIHRRPGHDGQVCSVSVSPDGKVLASASRNDPFVRLWDAATGRPLPPLPTQGRAARSCAFSADGKFLVSDGDDGTLRLWSAVTRQEVRRFIMKDVSGLPRRSGAYAIHLSPDGKRLAAVNATAPGQRKDGVSSQMSVWDARTGELLARRPFRGGLSSLFTPAGTGVSVDGTGYLTIEGTTTGRELAVIPGNLGDPVAFSPDGELVAAGIHKSVEGPGGGYQPQGVRVAEVLTGQEIFHVPGWIDFTAFSPDGWVLVTAGHDDFRLWDALTGKELFRRAWPEGMVYHPRWTPIGSLAFMPSGRALATGMQDGTVLVWDLASAKWPTNGPTRELDGLWKDLGGDARPAQQAAHALTAAPAQAIPFLGSRLRPVAAADPKRVEQWIGDLDSDRFEVREAASRGLSGLGEQVEPALRQALKGTPSAELRRRVQSLLDGLRAIPPAPVLRTLRAIRVLEYIHTPEARHLLAKLAAGAPTARETREAREALARQMP